MKKIISILMALVFVVASVQISAFAENKTYTVVLPVKFCQTESRKMLSRVNEFRTGNNAWYWNQTNTEKIRVTGRQALEYDYELEKVAMQRAAEIALYFDHTRPNGLAWYSIYPDYYSASENIACGFGNEGSAFEAWKEEDDAYSGQGHRRAMLSDSVTSVGIACVEYQGVKFWVQEFRGRNFKTQFTEPFDCNTKITVEVASSVIKSCKLSSTVNEISKFAGDTVDTPNVSAVINTTESVYGESNVSFTNLSWTSDNENIVRVSGNKLVCVAPGQTYLHTTICGQKYDVLYRILSQKGDVNGDSKINSSDALMILQHTVGIIELSEAYLTVADINSDKLINSYDSLLVLQYSVGLINSL